MADFRVRLVNRINQSERVTFKVTPDVIENRTVNYRSLDPVHLPGTFQVYQNTGPRQFGINTIRMVSRTQSEAAQNLRDLNILKSWTTPKFGQDDSSPGSLGRPPAVLLLSAYSDDTHRGNIYKVPVVILTLTLPYPSDVDYIPTDNSVSTVNEGVPVPTIMTLDIQMSEVHSPQEFSKFSLAEFKRGNLTNF